MCETILFLEKLFDYYLVFRFGYGLYGAVEDNWWRKNGSKFDRFLVFLLSPILLPTTIFIWLVALRLKSEEGK